MQKLIRSYPLLELTENKSLENRLINDDAEIDGMHSIQHLTAHNGAIKMI